MDAKRLLSILIATLLLVGSASLVTARGDDADDHDVRDAEDDASEHEDEAEDEEEDEADDASDDADDPEEEDAEDDADEAEDEAEDEADDAEDDSDEAEDEEDDSDEAELEDCDEAVVNGTLVCTDDDEDDELEQEDCDEAVVNGTLTCVEEDDDDDDERSGHDEADDEDKSGNGCVKTEVKYENEYVDENGTRVKEKYEAKGRDCEDDSKDRFEERASTKTKNATSEAEYEVETDSRPRVDGPATASDARPDKADEARSEVKVKVEEKRSDNLGQQVRKVVFEAKLQASKPIDALRQLFASWFG